MTEKNICLNEKYISYILRLFNIKYTRLLFKFVTMLNCGKILRIEQNDTKLRMKIKLKNCLQNITTAAF